MARACLGPSLIGQRLHDQCQCKKRAEAHFAPYSRELQLKAQAACNTNSRLNTAAEFAMAMNLTEAQIIELYGVDVDTTNATAINTTPKNQKFVNFLIFAVVLIALFFVVKKSL